MPERLKGYRILIVEDEYFIATELETALRMEAAEVIGPLTTAEKARSVVAEHVIHAAIVDIKLADEDGYQLADDLTEGQFTFSICNRLRV